MTSPGGLMLTMQPSTIRPAFRSAYDVMAAILEYTSDFLWVSNNFEFTTSTNKTFKQTRDYSLCGQFFQSINQSIEEFVTHTVVDRSSRNLRRVPSLGGWGGYTLRVVREVRWVFSRRLKVSNVFDSLITAGNSFQIVGAEKLKEHLPRLVVQKILTGWAETMRWLVHMKKISEVWWLVGWQLLYVRRAILYRPQPHLVEASLNFNICTNYRPLTSTLVWAQH